jgi:chromosome segregation ATPase
MGPDYKREFEKERQRLAQLWDAYEGQEKQINGLQEQINRLEITIYDKDKRIEAMSEELAGSTSKETSRKVRKGSKRKIDREDKAEIERLKEMIREERDRFSELFEMNEDLDLELKQAHSGIKERDRIIAQLKTMLESKDEQLQMLRSN